MERSRLIKLQLAVILRGFFASVYFRIKKDTIVFKLHWYSLKKVIIPIKEVITSILPNYLSSLELNPDELQKFLLTFRKLKDEESKVNLLYDTYIRFSGKITPEFSSYITKNIFVKKEFEIHSNQSSLALLWEQIAKKFIKKEIKKLQLLPSTVITPVQEEIMAKKEALYVGHRYGNISFVSGVEALIDSPTIENFVFKDSKKVLVTKLL